MTTPGPSGVETADGVGQIAKSRQPGEKLTLEHARKATTAKYMSQEQFDALNKMLEPHGLQADAKQTEVKTLCAKSPAIRPYVCTNHWHFSFSIPKNDPMCREHRAEYRESYAKRSAGQTKAKTKQGDQKATPASQSQAVAGASSSSRHDPPRSGRSQSPPPENRGTTRSRTPMHRSGSSARESTHHGASPAPANQSAERGHQTRDPSKGPMPPSGPSDGDRRARDRTPVPPPGSSAGDPTHHGAPSASAQHSAEAEQPRLKTPKENAMAIRAANHHRDPREGNRLEFEALELHEVRKDIDGMNAEDGFERWVRERDEQGWVRKGPRG